METKDNNEFESKIEINELLFYWHPVTSRHSF